MERIYRLVDKKGRILFQGTYEECLKKEKDRLEYVGISTPIYRVTDDSGLDVKGTMKELSAKLNIPYISLYNYTRFRRKHDGLFVEKIGESFL